MPMEDIRKIEKAEEEMRRRKEDAVILARQMRDAAKEKGEELLLQVRQEAAAQESEWLRRADTQAQEQQEILAKEIEAACAALRQEGESHLEEAVDFIWERIVKR